MILRPTAVDTIIQSSAVELFQSVGVYIAPRGRAELRGQSLDADLVGVISFDGPETAGNLTLAIPMEVYRLPSRQRPQEASPAEWTRELTNQLMGRIKNKLIQFRLKLRTHIPTVLSGAARERHNLRSTTEVLYTFTALRGSIRVAVDASLTRAPLEYSNADLLVNDDELILFD